MTAAAAASTLADLHWGPHLSVWAVMIAVESLYLWSIHKLGPKFVSQGEEPGSRSQMTLFTLGILTMWIFADWPIHDVAEKYLFSVHMVQHMAFALVGAPLILLGTPGWMLRPFLLSRPIRPIARILTRPVPATIAFNGFVILSHWQAFFDRVVRSEPLHFGAHFVLVVTALLMWWPVLSPLPELPRLGHSTQLLYLFIQTVVPTVPASFLTFASSPFYSVYRNAPRIIGMSATTDQTIGGLIMKLGGGFYLWTIIAVLFFRWSSREETGKPDAVDWQSIELQLNRPAAPK